MYLCFRRLYFDARRDRDTGIPFAFLNAMLGLFLAGLAYALGTYRLWRRAGSGRGITRARVACFAAGLATLAAALFSPMDAMSDALFSAHMVQHLLLVVVAAPLLVLGDPQYVMLWLFDVDARRSIARWWRGARGLRAPWRVLSHPLVAWSLHVVAIWVWHVPRMYDTALRDERIHIMEHLSFLLTALLFWWVVLDRHRLRVGVATFYLFAAALQCTLLGALLAMARHPWYVAHHATTQAWGFSPLEDQQLAGLIMWVPTGLVYLAAILPRLIDALTEGKSAAITRTAPLSSRV